MDESSLPEFMNFKPFWKTILVVNIKFGLSWGHPLSNWESQQNWESSQLKQQALAEPLQVRALPFEEDQAVGGGGEGGRGT